MFCRPHFGASRKIHDGQKIHSSLLLGDRLINRMPYTPKARPVRDDPHFWENAWKNGLGDWQELDLYIYADNLVERFAGTLDSNLFRDLQQTASWGEFALFS